MRILLIRHGRQNSPLCNVDVPLSEEGRAQADLLGERLKHEGIDVVWSSGLCRAVETADRINEALKVKRVIREDLKEISFGDLEGLADPVIAERFGSFLSQRKKMEQDLPYPGGESAADVVKRVLPVMDEILGLRGQDSGSGDPRRRDPQHDGPLPGHGAFKDPASGLPPGKLRDHRILVPGGRHGGFEPF